MRFLPSLAVGVIAGAASTWLLVRPTPSAETAAEHAHAGATKQTAAASASRKALTLVLPARLGAQEASSALDAYLALPPLPADAPASAFNERAARLRALLTALPNNEFRRLFETLAVHEGENSRRLRWIAYDVWIERDPTAAAAWAVSIVPGPALNEWARDRYLSQALEYWAHSDFDGAYAWASALSDKELADTGISHLILKLVATDPARAIRLAQSRGEEFVASLRPELIQTWARTDPAAALQTLGAAQLDKEHYNWQVRSALIYWVDKDPEQALAWAKANGGDESNQLLSGWQIAQDSRDPGAIANLFASDSRRTDYQSQLFELVGGWTYRDPKAARDWLATMSDPAQRADLIDRISGETLAYNGNAADYLGIVDLLPAGTLRDQKVTEFLGKWARSDPDAALAWLGTHDGPEYAAAASQVQGALIAALAANDPLAAVARLQAVDDPATKNAAIPNIAREWARTDPAASAQWLAEQIAAQPALTPEQKAAAERLPPGTRLQNGPTQLLSALSSTMAAWVRQDSLAALQWAESQSDASILDQTVASITDTWVSPLNRTDSANLLAQIEDPQVRERSLNQHLSNWLRSDARSARAWIESHDVVSAEDAAKLLAAAGIKPGS